MFLHSIARFFLGSFAQQKEERKFPAHQSNQSINISPFFQLNQPTLMASLKALANEDILLGHIVADTNVSPFSRARNICCGHKLCVWFCSETFWVRNKCFPVCAALETSWATMCPQQCVLVYQALKATDMALYLCGDIFLGVKPSVLNVKLRLKRNNLKGLRIHVSISQSADYSHITVLTYQLLIKWYNSFIITYRSDKSSSVIDGW